MSFTLANIDIGVLPNDGTGDPLRVAFGKINNNFSTSANVTPGGPAGALQYSNVTGYSGTANLVYDQANNVLNLGANIIPNPSSVVYVGNSTLPIDSIYANNYHVGNVTISEDGNIISFPITVDNTVSASLAHIKDISITGNLTVANSTQQVITATTRTNSPRQVIFQSPVNSFTSAVAKVTTNQPGAYNTQSVTIQITKRNDNTGVQYEAYGTQFMGQPVTTYDIQTLSDNVQLMVNPLFSDVMNHIIDITIYN